MQLFDMPTDDTLRATVRHGTADLPFACYDDDIKKYKGGLVEWHWHREFEFAVVTTETVDCLIDGACLTVAAGDGVFINSSVIHRFETAGAGRMTALLFLPEFIAPADSAAYRQCVAPVRSSGLPYAVLRREDEKQRPILTAAEAVRREAQAGDAAHPLRLQLRVGELWACFFQAAERALPPADSAPQRLLQTRLRQMLDCIHRQYRRPLRLEEIAAAANVSKSEALRCFRLGVNTTPVRYLNEYRLHRAAEQLLSTDDPVSAVGWDCGFESPGYFCRAFHRRWGRPPESYRQSARRE